MQKLIQRKLKELELMQGGGGKPDALAMKAAQNEPLAKEMEAITTELSKILKDGEKDSSIDLLLKNKQKIDEIKRIYYDKIVSLYTRSFLDLMQLGQECVTNEYLNEFHEGRLKAAENLTQKYKMLSTEYQS